MNEKELKRRFRWSQDRVDGWRILDDPSGPLRGDCDDFALTAAYLASDSSLIKLWMNILFFRLVFWFCTSPDGDPHLMLYDRRKGQWIDNIYPDWGPRRHPRRWPAPFFVVAVKMLIGKLSK